MPIIPAYEELQVNAGHQEFRASVVEETAENGESSVNFPAEMKLTITFQAGSQPPMVESLQIVQFEQSVVRWPSVGQYGSQIARISNDNEFPINVTLL